MSRLPPGASMGHPLLVVLSDADPVARVVGETWGGLPATGHHVEGAVVRSLGSSRFVLRRPGNHIHDERLDRHLPSELAAARPTLVFPSVHRSERGVACLTVHPIGNPGPRAEVGGRPRTLVPTDPSGMTSVLRALAEAGGSLGLPVSYEATHHGPELLLPAFFVEVAHPIAPDLALSAARLLRTTLEELEILDGDRPAVAVGGGHYAPHFTDLALGRRWSFGHILSRYALAEIDRATAEASLAQTPGAEGILVARAEDAKVPALHGVARRLGETEAPVRSGERELSRAARPASGT